MITIRRAVTALALSLTLASCAADGDPTSEPTNLLEIPGPRPGDLVGLVADDERRVVSWLHRIEGTVHELDIDDADAVPQTVGRVDVGTDSQQGGLLDQALLGTGERIVAYTDTEQRLVFATFDGDDPPLVWWDAGPAGNGAIGGTIDAPQNDGMIVFSVGRNVDWSLAGLTAGEGVDLSNDEIAVIESGGALLRSPVDRSTAPTVVSTGYTNPWAFEVVGDDELWVWDNAAGPDPDDPDDPARDDVERFGRGDLGPRSQLVRSEVADRAPTAMIELPDGRLGVCGFLDGELRAYEIVDGDDGPRRDLERAGSIMPCLTDAAVFGDGTIVTIAQTDDDQVLLILRP